VWPIILVGDGWLARLADLTEGILHAEAIERDNVVGYICCLSKTLGPKSRTRRLSAIRTFFGFSMAKGWRLEATRLSGSSS
jgi:site-specific recombinase XerD